MKMDQTHDESNTDHLRKMILAVTTAQVELCMAAQFILDHSPTLEGREVASLQGIIRALADSSDRLMDDVSVELCEMEGGA